MNVLELIASLTLDTSGWDSKLASASKSAAQFSDTVPSKFKSVNEVVKGTGKALSVLGGGIVGTAGLTVKAAADYESAFTGVLKTIEFEAQRADETSEEYAKRQKDFYQELSDGLWELAKKYPVTIDGLAGIAEQAGQLGVQNENILDFTEVIAGLTMATNLGYEEGATLLAKFANVAGMSQADFDNLASTIVRLGNNTATTEKYIAKFALENANLAQTTSMSASDVVALGATFSSLGVRAEGSRTAMQRLRDAIIKAVNNGGDELEKFAEISGMTADEFSKKWKEDAMGAILAFTEGLSTQGEKQASILEYVGIESILAQDSIMRLANGHVVLSNNVKLANESFQDMGKTEEEYNALQIEVAKRNETLDSKWQELKNSVQELAVEYGNALIPKLKELLPEIQKIVEKVTNYVKENPKVIENVTKVGAALLGLGTTITTITNVATAINTISTAIKLLTGGGAAAGAAKVAGAAGAAGAAAGGGGLIGGLIAGLGAIGPAVLAVGATAGIFAINWKKDWGGVRTTYEETLDATNSKSEAFKASFDQFTTVLGTLVYNKGKGIADWWNNSASPWFDGVGDHIRGWFTKQDTTVSEGMEQTKSTVDTAHTDIGSRLTEWLTTNSTSISEWFANLGTSLGEWFTNLLTSISEWLTNLWTNVGEWFTNLWASLSEWLTNLWSSVSEWLTTTWTSVTEWFNTAITNVSEWLTNLWTSVTEWFTTAIANVSEWLTNLWANVTEWFNTAIANVTEWLTNLWTNVTEWFNEAINWIKQTATEWWQNVTEWFNEAVDWIKQTATEWWNNVQQWFNEAVDWIKETATEWWNNVQQWFQNAVNWIKETATEWWNNVQQWFNEAVDWIKQTATEWWNNVQQWFNEIVDWISQTATDFWNSMIEWFTNLISKIEETLTNIKETTHQRLEEIWNTLTEKLSQIWETIREKLEEIWNTIREKLEGIKQTVVEKVTALWHTAQEKLHNFAQVFRDVFEEVKNAISEKMHAGLAAVESVVESMKQKVRGVLDAIGDAWHKVENFVSSAWERISSVTSSIFGGYYASGGWMEAGKTYMVGEEGPELITATRSGYVHNAKETANMLGGNRDIIININGDIYDDQNSMRKKLRGAVMDVLREQVAYG